MHRDQQHRTPLSIDFNEALKCDQGESPDLVITDREHIRGHGKREFFLHYFASEEERFSSRQVSDQSEEERIAGYSDDDLKRTISKYRNHLNSGLNLKDKGEKIRKLLDRLIQEQERRQQPKNEASRDWGQARMDNSMSPSRYTGMKESFLKPSNNALKVDSDSTHEMNNTGAFDTEIGAMKGWSSNVHSHQITERNKRQCDQQLDENKTSTSLVATVQRGEKNIFAYKGVLGKRTNARYDSYELDLDDALVSANSVQKTIRQSVKSVTKEGHLNGPNNAVTRSLKKKVDCIGSSLNTAMELSDDEEDIELGNKENGYHLSRESQGIGGFKFAYPGNDPEAVEVHESDLRHLEPYEFLNDTVIDFYIKYIQRPENLSSQKQARFQFFNSFFYKKLLLEKTRKDSNYYSKLRKWVRGVNIFEKYLIVPVHESAHWSLAIVCFSMEDNSTLQPYILHLDSMRDGHATSKVAHILEGYLKAEWIHKGGIEGVTHRCEAFASRVDVPLQQNAWDCGLFLLYFIQRFVEDAPSEFTVDSMNSMFGRDWFKPQEASNLRGFIRKLVKTLGQKENVVITMEDMD